MARLQAQLKEAEFYLGQTTVVAPADGYSIGMTLQPGQRVGTARVGSVLNYVVNDRTRLIAWINQINIRHVKPGQPAEVVLQLYPGKTLNATVDSINLMSETGQLKPSGDLPAQPTGQQPPGQYAGDIGDRLFMLYIQNFIVYFKYSESDKEQEIIKRR